MDDDDDFTFPTVAAARGPTTTAPERQLGRDDQDTVLHLPAAAGASPLWPFAGSVPKTMATTTTAPPPSASPPVTADHEQGHAPVPVSGSSTGRAWRSAVPEEEQQQEEETCRVAADEDRMDLLWEVTTTTTTRSSIATAPAPEPRSLDGAHAGPPPPKQRAAAADVGDDDKQRAAALADAERMDKLWESFNEDLVLRHRHRHRDRARRSKSAADHPGGSSRVVPRAPAGGPDDDDDRWYLCNDYDSPSSGAGDESASESDQETTSASSPAERRGYGCAPTMLRASSRAGGAGQFCAASASPRARRRRRGRGAAAGWALLLRLFRRLFAADKTAAPSSRSHSSLYVP